VREIPERDPVGSSRWMVIEETRRLHPESTLSQVSKPTYRKATSFTQTRPYSHGLQGNTTKNIRPNEWGIIRCAI
jgi:hypothetical protein